MFKALRSFGCCPTQSAPAGTPIVYPWNIPFRGSCKNPQGYVDDSIKRQRGWPKNGKGLSDQLRRLASPLRTIGLDIEFARMNKERRIKVQNISQQNA
jgi:hypothetical protein